MNENEVYPKVIAELINAYNSVYGVVDNITYISITQSILRSFDALNSEFNVLHASAAVNKKGTTIIFGDDGNICRGKTFSSLYVAANSGKFISDEYVIFNKKSYDVYGNGSIPINLKGETAKFFEDKLNIKFKDSKVIFANDYFKIIDKCNAKVIVIPFFEQAENKLIEVEGKEKSELLKATFYGHNAKFLNPSLDRLSVIKQRDLNIPINMNEVLVNYPNVNGQLQVYKMYVKDLEQIPNLINEL